MDSIQTLLDEVIKKDNDANQRDAVTSPSNMGGCIRKLMLMERKAEAIPFEPITLRIFRVGYLFEKFVLDALEKSGKLVQRQKTVEYRGMKGTLDSTIMLNGKETLFDVKSCKTDKFKYLDTEGVDENYTYQLSFYHRAYKKECPELSDIARVFYTEKDNLLIKEMPLTCPDHYKKIDDKLDEIEYWRKQKELPMVKTQIDWECFSVSKRYKKCKVWCRWYKNCPSVVEAYDKQVKDFGGGK